VTKNKFSVVPCDDVIGSLVGTATVELRTGGLVVVEFCSGAKTN
jgi:hypothetical protein